MANELIRLIPEDFPRQGQLGTVSGAQPKLVARKIDGRFVKGLTDEELWVRYDNCADLVQQLVAYTRRKLAAMPGTTLEELLPRVRKGVKIKGWDVTGMEMDWIFDKVADRLDQGVS